MVQMKNKIAVLLMEAGVSYNKKWLHKAPATSANCWRPIPILMKGCVPCCEYVARRSAIATNRDCPGETARARFTAAGSCGAANDDSRRGADHGATKPPSGQVSPKEFILTLIRSKEEYSAPKPAQSKTPASAEVVSTKCTFHSPKYSKSIL